MQITIKIILVLSFFTSQAQGFCCFGKQKNLLLKNQSLIEACKNGDLVTVRKHLDRGADINVADQYGNTVLILAICSGRTAVARLLLDDRGIKVNTVNKYGNTALMLAAGYGDVDSTRLLFTRDDVDVNIVNKDGHTALMDAAFSGHTATAKELLDHDADINIVAKHGETALSVAFKRGNTAIVEMLEQKARWSPERSAWFGTVVRVSKDTYPSS